MNYSREQSSTKVGSLPDGGWGWVIVVSSFAIHALSDGFVYTFGIFYDELLKTYGESQTKTSWVISILIGSSFLFGPVSSAVTNKYGCRIVTIAGSLIASFGLILSVFAPSLPYLFFTIGILTGGGTGLMSVPALTSVSCFFEKKRGLATGISLCGTGFGTFLLAPLNEFLLDYYGLQGSFLILAGLLLNCSVFGLLFRPPIISDKNVSKLPAISSQENLVIFKDISATDKIVINSAPATTGQMAAATISSQLKTQSDGVFYCRSPLDVGLLYYKDILVSTTLPSLHDFPEVFISTRESTSIKKKFQCPKEITDVFFYMLDMTLLMKPSFLVFALCNFFTSVGFNIPYVYLKNRVVNMGVATNHQAGLLLSIVGISNTFGRMFVGLLTYQPCLRPEWTGCAFLFLCGIGTVLTCFSTQYYHMALYGVLFGLTTGICITLTSVLLVELFGLDKFTNAFGLLLMFIGVASFIGAPITGFLHDYFGSYNPGFYVAGVMLCISSFFLFLAPRLKQC